MGLYKLRMSLPGLAALAGITGLLSAPAAQAQTAYAIGNGGSSLIRFNVANPTAASLVGNFTFGGTRTFLDAIDFRPLNGQLYGYLDSTDTLYTVDLNTAILSAVASGSGASATNTFQLGMDFNPTIDRVRVVTDSTQNLVYNPNSSAAPTVNTTLFYQPGDVNVNSNALIIDNAYSNNLQGRGLPTTQYGIDYGLNTLVTINNNLGNLATVGSLGVDADEYTGFDIFTSLSGVNTGYAILNGATNPSLYTINLGTGAATRVGSVGGTNIGGPIYSLAVTPVGVAPEPGSLALLVGAMATAGVPLYRRRKRAA